MEIPPWLQITPSSYLQAMEAGSQIGLHRQQLAQQAQEAQQRNQIASREFAQRQIESQQAGQEHAAALDLQRNRLSFDDANTRNQQDAANALKIAQIQQDAMQFGVNSDYKDRELQQRGDLGQQRVDMDNQRAADLLSYRNSNLDNRSALLELKKEIADKKIAPQDLKTETETIPADAGSPADVTTHWFKNMFGANLPPTTNSPAIPPRNEVHITRKIPINADSPAAAALTQPTTNSLPDAVQPATKPTPKDVSYLASHPETKSKFEARFGVGSADLYLP